MRLLASIALLGLAIASSLTWESSTQIGEDRFLVGREYRYLFDGQIATGLVLPDTHRSATRLQAIVTLQPIDERVTLLQLTKIRFGSIQKAFEPREILPFERFEFMKLEKEYEDMLAIPIRFTYRHGMISDIEFTDEDKPWSVNIKKALLNMLQINLLKRYEMKKDERDDDSYNRNSFATFERTFEGECEVEYTTMDTKDEFARWTKAINFQKCNVRPEVRYGITPRDFKKNDEKLFSTVLKFKLEGDKEDFLIHEVDLESQYKLMPLSKKHELITSNVLNRMKLIYAGKIETEIPRMQYHRKESLIYNLEWELAEENWAMTGDEKHLSYMPEWKNKIEHIEKLLTVLTRETEHEIKNEHTHLFARLVKLLRMCREQELLKVLRFLEKGDTVNNNVLSLYYDALAIAGTKVTIKVLAKRIIEEKVDDIRASRLLKSLTEVRVPSEEIAEEILRVCKSDIAEKTPHLKQTCWLTYGAIFNGLCNNDKLAVYHVDNICKRELKEKVVRKLADMFKKAETRFEKVLILKVLGNAGIDISIYELEKIIYDKQEEEIVRFEAIHALRKLRVIMPRKIQSILMPIYKNRTEITTIRMQALLKLMQTRPEQTVIDQIVRQMEIERDQHFRSFIYRTLKSISELPEIHEKTIHYVKMAMRTVDTEFYDNLSRHVMQWTLRNVDYRYGLSWKLNNLVTKDSILPKEIDNSLDIIFGGDWYKYFAQLGIIQYNVDEPLNKLLKKLQETDMEHLVVRGKRSTFYHPSEIFKSIYEKLNFVRRHPKKEDAHAMLYFTYKDIDYAFLPMDENTIPKTIKNIFRDGKLQLDELEQFLTTGTHFTETGGFYIYDYMRKIPTTIGLPLVFTSKMPTLAKIQGNFRMEVQSKESKAFNGLQVHLLLKPKLSTTHVVKAVVMNPVVESGFKMLHTANFDYPLEAETKVTWRHKLQVRTSFRPLQHKKNVFHLQTRPVTFVRHMKKTKHMYPEPVENTVHLPEHLYPINSFEHTFFKGYGTHVKLTGTMHRPIIRKTESLLNPTLVGYNTVDVYVEPSEDMPKEYVFHMEVETFIPERLEKPELKMLFKNNDEMFNVETEEFEKRREDHRQTHLATYLRNFNIEKAYKHRMLVKIEAIGQRRKHEAEMEVMSTCDVSYRFCRTHFFARRTPMEKENSDWELKAEMQILYPEVPKSLKQLKEQNNREVLGIADAVWGSDHKNNLFIRVQAEQSREQKLWMPNINREKNILTEMERLRFASKLNVYKLMAKYEVTPETAYYSNMMFSIIKSWNTWNMGFEKVDNREGVVRAIFEIEPLNRQMFDLLIETPTERVTLKKMRMPIKLPTVNIYDIHMPEFTTMKDFVKHIFKSNRAECMVKSEKVETFDNLRFSTPLSTCYTVLAKDCTSEEPRFVVLMKKIDKEREEKRLKIVGRDDLYVMEMVDRTLVVKVNGRQLKDEEFMKYRITKVDDQFYKVDFGDGDVLFDGFEAKIQLSFLYRNKQCGLCGHFDGEKWNDLRRADNEETIMVEDFHRSYITKDDECDRDDNEMRRHKKQNEYLEKDLKHHNYRQRERKDLLEDELDYKKWENDEHDTETNKPSLRTRVIERRNLVCFSTEPVLVCPEHTKEKDVREQEVEFVCLHNSREARRLHRMAREEIIPRRLLDGETWRTTVHVPKMCTVY